MENIRLMDVNGEILFNKTYTLSEWRNIAFGTHWRRIAASEVTVTQEDGAMEEKEFGVGLIGKGKR